jgi:hypothetical protein
LLPIFQFLIISFPLFKATPSAASPWRPHPIVLVCLSLSVTERLWAIAWNR